MYNNDYDFSYLYPLPSAVVDSRLEWARVLSQYINLAAYIFYFFADISLHTISLNLFHYLTVTRSVSARFSNPETTLYRATANNKTVL